MTATSAGRVLVAGAGVAGLAVARALHRRGIPVLVLERRDEPSDAGLAVNLPGNAIRALGDLGLAEALQSCGSPVRRRAYRDARDRLLFSVDEDAFWGEAARPRCLRRADLLDMLGHDLPGDGVRRRSTVRAVRGDPSGVSVELADGTREAGRLLVGADGVHSTVRRTVFSGAAPGAARLARASWRFMVPDPGIECWTLWAGRHGMILLIPVDRGEAYGWVALTGPRASGDPRELARAFAGFPAVPREALTRALARPETLHHSPLEEVRLPVWHRDRVILAGDAAHATAPVWAQGAGLALEDALVLADVLSGGDDWSGAGAAFERRRRSRVAHVQAATDRMSRTARLPVGLRTLLLPVLGPRNYRAAYGPLRASALA